jgi:hypothetical protein
VFPCKLFRPFNSTALLEIVKGLQFAQM